MLEDGGHDYHLTPSTKRKKTTDNVENMYMETVTILRSIHTTLDNRLANINESIANLTRAVETSRSNLTEIPAAAAQMAAAAATVTDAVARLLGHMTSE